MAEAVTVEGLEKRYGRVEALRGISLSVKRGEIFGLLGANGAGKTTLIRILVGLARPTAGSVSVLGFDPNREAAALRRQVGFMPQSPALYLDLSTRANVAFFGAAHPHENSGRRVEEIIDFVALRERAHDPVHTLSGGMKQRVSLGCALFHKPALLLLDEPTAGVDPPLREIFWKHFRDLAASGATIVVSTHQLDEALACDRLAVMRDGAVLACDSPAGLLRRGRTTVRVKCGDAIEEARIESTPEALAAHLKHAGLSPEVASVELVADTLETIVLDLVRRGGAP
ncbi:MAG: ABC-2 type transport system ATP-binding [Planctomycetota bacterium]|nr:MAG: ABC-2 type transport system ATP-binding [Planctomycetota bacterium]